MNTIPYQKQVKLHLLKTTKFKDVTITVRFLNDLVIENATKKALLSIMMQDRSHKYDTKQKLSNHLDLLYGASLSTKTMGIGQSQILEVKARAINDQYVLETLLEQQVQLLHEVIFNPLLNEEVLQEAKKVLVDSLTRNLDNPSQCAVKKAMECAGKGYALSISSQGDLNKVNTITLQDVQDFYLTMLNTDQIDIFVVGEVDEERMTRLVHHYLPFKDRTHTTKLAYSFEAINKVKEEEFKPIDQTNLVMVYNTPITIIHPLYWSLRVANAILGQLPTSKLFQEVREKHSLCYSIYSSCIAFEGILYVATGIEDAQIDKTLKLIQEQIVAMQNGDFTEEDVQVAKDMISNSIISSVDDASSIISLEYQNSLLNRKDSVEEIKSMIQAVNKKDMIAAMQTLKENTTYLLRKGEKDE